MKKSVISMLLVIFILFVTSCGGSTTSDASGDIGDEAYYESDDTGYEPGYNDNSDTGDSAYTSH